ncbi:MAG: heparinase II/III family protein [Sphingobacteriaceae bacterium]|nr:heparinase II/III family protein [Sphingobacteriaceae bacterium]
MRVKRFFKIENYKFGLEKLLYTYKIKKLEHLKIEPIKVSYIWPISSVQNYNVNIFPNLSWSIFGHRVDLDKIEWHKDYVSEFVYPKTRVYKLKIDQWFDKGIDIKFPWELSRFYFAVSLGQKYLITKDEIYYNTFRSLVLDWINENPFLYGVNWLSTMEVAIRSINWIVSINLFSNLVKNDEDFQKTLSQSLLQHAEYIHSFPEIYENGLTTNHTTAGYSGLLFLGLSLKAHPKSKLWIDTAINGLERCIREQIAEDGVDFEGSIPYHRLVLEMFAYSVIVASAQNIKLSGEFYATLFKMFEYTSAYIDKSGNAPQVGDNDSGRLIVFSVADNNPYISEHDHSYLLSLGEHLFDYKFRSQSLNRDNIILNYLPRVEKVNIDELLIIPRKTDHSISFKESGSYFIKNTNFSFLLSCFPIGQNGKGGHNHLDVGSFTLSINGKPVIVDPGTFTYTTNKSVRDKFRSYSYHNMLYTPEDEKIDWNENDFWSLRKYHDFALEKINSEEIKVNINSIGDKINRRREFKLKENVLSVEDFYEGCFFSRINLHPDVLIIDQHRDKIEFNNFDLNINYSGGYKIVDYDYSPCYGKVIKSKSVIFTSNKFLKLLLYTKL